MNIAWAHEATLLLSATLVGTAVALMADLLLRFLPRTPATARSAVWAAALLVIAALPFALPMFRFRIAVTSAHAARGPHFMLGSNWLIAFSVLWAVLSLMRAGQLLASARWMLAVLRGAQPAQLGPQSSTLIHNQALTRRVEVCVTSDVDVPCVAGFMRPRVLLPQGLPEMLSDHDLRRVLQHELEHVRRWDDWTNLLQKCVLVLFPLHPGLWLVEHRLCAERESACDERVVQMTGAPKAYAMSLTNLAERSLTQRRLLLALAAWTCRSELAGRIQRILRKQNVAWSSARTAVAVSFTTAAFVAGAIGLNSLPHLVEFAVAAPTPAIAMVNAPVKTHSYEARVFSSESLPGAQSSRRKTVHVQKKTQIVPETATPAFVEGSASEPDTTLVKMDSSVKMHAKSAVWMVGSEGDFAAIPVSGGWLIVRL